MMRPPVVLVKMSDGTRHVRRLFVGLHGDRVGKVRIKKARVIVRRIKRITSWDADRLLQEGKPLVDRVSVYEQVADPAVWERAVEAAEALVEFYGMTNE